MIHPEYFHLLGLSSPLEWFFLRILKHLHVWSSYWSKWNVTSSLTNLQNSLPRDSYFFSQIHNFKFYMFVIYANSELQQLHFSWNWNSSLFRNRASNSDCRLFSLDALLGALLTHLKRTRLRHSLFIAHLFRGIPLLCACSEVR